MSKKNETEKSNSDNDTDSTCSFLDKDGNLIDDYFDKLLKPEPTCTMKYLKKQKSITRIK